MTPASEGQEGATGPRSGTGAPPEEEEAAAKDNCSCDDIDDGHDGIPFWLTYQT